MKAITLRAPWAWAVAHAGKDIENRSTRCPSLLGERIAIHAGAAPKTDAAHALHADDFLAIWQVRGVLPNSGQMGPDFGCIVAVATVVGWATEQDRRAGVGSYVGVQFHPHPLGARSPWFTGPFGWLLHDVQALPDPVPARGKQGIWTLGADVEAAVLAQVGGG